MIRRPPRSTLSSSSAASDVYKRQLQPTAGSLRRRRARRPAEHFRRIRPRPAVSYTHLRAHETPEQIVCRLLLEKKKSATVVAQLATRLQNSTSHSLKLPFRPLLRWRLSSASIYSLANRDTW